MNHLALTLASEEKDVTTVAIRPGVSCQHLLSLALDFNWVESGEGCNVKAFINFLKLIYGVT